MKFEDTNPTNVIDSHHGIYVCQIFAQKYKDALKSNLFPADDLEILLTGPDHEEYLDVWSDLFPCELKDTDGKSYMFIEIDGDIWEIEKEKYELIEWEEI